MLSFRAMSVLQRGIARLSKRRKKQRELPAIIEQEHAPQLIPQQLELPDTSKPSLLGRSMDRLRKSFRQSFRRNRSHESHPPALVNTPDGNGRTEAWQPDEAAVRAGICSFPVKYLGAVEVFESRGMPICENALKHLRTQKRHPVKAILYVSGDGLRVVDQEKARGLMVDQTIEKVSFCAPDRHNDKGFAYICRDGTTRRWMCHGFLATKDSGDRLSHAVGCAFSICLEKKKKRDEENMYSNEKAVPVEKALNPDWGDKTAMEFPPANQSQVQNMQRTNNAYQSFRKAISISERLQDPQAAIVNEAPTSSNCPNIPGIAKPRPAANPALFQRQGSLRAPEAFQNTQFRRNFSLRTPVEQSKRNYGTALNNEPIYEGDEENLIIMTPTTSATYIPQNDGTTKPISSSFPTFSDFSTIPSNGFNHLPAQELPDLMSFSDITEFNQPISVNTQFSSPAPILSNNSRASRADDWLNNTLKTSMSFNSPTELTPSSSMSSIQNGRYQPAANGPNGVTPQSMVASPPPIPQRPPGVAAAPGTTPIPSQLNGNVLKTNGTDAFGQAVNWEPMSPRRMPKPDDPFDIQWSKMTISANNPFASEQPRITT